MKGSDKMPLKIPVPPPPPYPPHFAFSTLKPKPNLRNPARKPHSPSIVQRVRFAGFDKDHDEEKNLLGNIKMKRSPSGKLVGDVVTPPPTLSSGEGEEIPLETPVCVIDKATPATSTATPSKVTPDFATAASHPKSLKTRLDQLLSPHPRFGRPDGRGLFSPRGFVGLSNENEPPRSPPPPGRFFVALAISLALLGVALLVAVVVYNTRHIDRLFRELEEKKHNIVPADAHDPAIEPLPPSAVSYVHWPSSDRLADRHETQSEESSEEMTANDDKMQTRKKRPFGRVSFPDLKLFVDKKDPWNDSYPLDAVVHGTFGTLNGTLDLTKFSETFHAHTRKKRQVRSYLERTTLKDIKRMKAELIDQNEKIVHALRVFNVAVKDLAPPKVGLLGLSNPAVIELAKTALKKLDPPSKRANLKLALSEAVRKNKMSQKAIDLLVEKREKNINLIGEINSIIDILEHGQPVIETKMTTVRPLDVSGARFSSTASNDSTSAIVKTQAEKKLAEVANLTASSVELAVNPTYNVPSVHSPVQVAADSNDTKVSSTVSSVESTLELGVNPNDTEVSSTTPGVQLGTVEPTVNFSDTMVSSTSPSVDGTSELEVNSSNCGTENTDPGQKCAPIEVDLIQMGRESDQALSPWKLDSPKQSGKKSEIEKVELQENLQSMENATNDSMLARASGFCHSGHIPCWDGTYCLLEQFWCDGAVDCVDASDEMYCSCRDRVDRDRLCDGYFDCPNGEDELGCLGCGRYDFNCGDFDDRGRSTCAPTNARCDGKRDCPSGKDEQSCSLLADGILVGNFPGQLAAVSASRGVLHHNWHGKWLPVCWTEADLDWATAVCREVVSPDLTSLDVKLHQAIIPPFKYRGQWISLSDGVSVQESCEFASYVVCPAIIPGSRVPPSNDPTESHWETDEASGTNYDELLALLGQANVGIENALNEGKTLDDALESEGLDPSNSDDVMQALEDLAGSFSSSPKYADDVSRPTRMVSGRVVGGSKSLPGAWPWVIALYEDGRFTCGGAILNNEWVLTAAHCVTDAEDHFLEVQAGMLRRSDFSPTEQTVIVDRVAVNKKFKFYDMVNDIAMLHVSPTLKLNRWVRPILLPSSSDELLDPGKLHITDPMTGHKCTVVGWGATAEYGPSADNEREVVVPVEGCASAVDQKGNEICAGVAQGGRDSCQGDSGGPLLCNVPESPSLWFAAGIVSHGEGCGRPREPGAYTRVSTFVDWIKVIMSGQAPDVADIKYPHLTCPGYYCNAVTKRCIPRRKRCDKVVDCLHADDEENCEWNAYEFFQSGNTTSEPRSSKGYHAFKPTTRNESVWFKSSDSTGDVTKVVHSVNEVVASFAKDDTPTPRYPEGSTPSPDTTTRPPETTTPLPETTTPPFDTTTPPFDTTTPPREKTNPPPEKTTPPPQTTTPTTIAYPPSESTVTPHSNPEYTSASKPGSSESIVFPGPQDGPKPASFPPPLEPVNPDAEKSGPPPPVGEPLAPPPTEQVNPTPDFPIQGHDLITSESSLPKNSTTNGDESSDSSESLSSESSSSESGKKPSDGQSEESASNEHSEEEAEPPKASSPMKPLKPELAIALKPFQEQPPIPVLTVTTKPVPEPTLQQPYLSDFDPNQHFLCSNMRQKITRERYCDGIADCVDSSDESDCTCRDKLQALGSGAICDGLTDCFDGSDEKDCFLCSPGQFRCGLSLPPKCIPESAECDGVEDCPRGEDEERCLALTDGATVILDRDGFPVVRQEGVVARKKRGVWETVCGLSKAGLTWAAWAYDTCTSLGYSEFEGYNETSVTNAPLVSAFELSIPLVGPKPRPPPVLPAPLAQPAQNSSASHCAAISVRCSPHIEGNTDRFLVADGVHAWPWHAELLVDGVPCCSGVLVHPNWVVTSHQCTSAVRFDINQNMLTVLMGGPRSNLGVLEPFEQVRRADDIRLIANTDILMVHLAAPFIETRHVRATGLPDWFSMARRALICVAVGRGADGAWESLLLQHDIVCPQGEGLGKSCFTPLSPNAGCTTNATTAPWAGCMVCRAHSGWYPAAVYYELNGRCALAGTQAYDALFYSLRSIRSLIDGLVVGGAREPPCAGFRCAEGTCLPAHAACNGVPECRDASDENPRSCSALKRKCSSGNGQGCVCGPGEARCAGAGGCIPLTSWCDGKPDCPDGSDEGTTCTCADLLKVTRPYLLCDGRLHCEDRSDESPAVCPYVPGKFLCASTYHGVSFDVVCDGYNDCPNGEDEETCFTLKPFDAPSVSYNAFGEVIRRTYGMWHEMCALAEGASTSAAAACAAIKLSLASFERGPRFPDPTKSPVLLVDPFTRFFIANRSAISVRADRPLAIIEHRNLPPEECPALRVTCT